MIRKESSLGFLLTQGLDFLISSDLFSGACDLWVSNMNFSWVGSPCPDLNLSFWIETPNLLDQLEGENLKEQKGKRKKENKRVCPGLYDSYFMMLKLHNRIDNHPEHSQFEYFCRMCICLCQYGFGETPNYNRINFKMKIRNLSCMIIISYDAQITKYNR